MRAKLPILISLTSLTLALCACGGGEELEEPQRPPRLPASGDQYIVDQILLGADQAEVNSFGFDFDGDDRPDNYLGSAIRAAYSGLGRESQEDIDLAVASGEMIHLLMLGAPDDEFLDAARLFLGTDTDDDASNNFSGEAELAIRPTTPLDGAVYGERTAGELSYVDGAITLENTLFGAVTLPLARAQLRGAVNDDGTLTGAVGGIILEDDIETELKPAIIASMLADVAAQCGSVAGSCCEPGSRGADWVALFDESEDCALTESEIRRNDIFRILLAPDIDDESSGEPLGMSVGFGFTAVPARFTVPR